MELRGKNRIPVSNYYDRERNTSSVSEGVLYNALLLGGRYEKGFEMCKGNGPLGWSSSENPKPVFVTFMISKDGAEKHCKGGNVDIKEFIKELKRVTDDYTLEKYYNAFTRIARNISPSERKIILNILGIVEKQNMDDLDTGSLLKDIKSFSDRVKSGKYYDHWDWDEKTHREREFGDESWADEMDAFFRKARHAYEKKEYRIAILVRN